MSGTRHFRVHPLLLIYPATVAGARSLVAETTSSSPPLLLREPLVWFAISLLPARFTSEDAIQVWKAEPELGQMAEDLWQVMTGEELVIAANDDTGLLGEPDFWAQRGWREAAMYHESTRDFPFVRMDEPEGFEYDEALMAQFAEEEHPPPIAVRLGGGHRIPLRKIGAEESAESTLDAVPERDRSGVPGLSLLFDICSGERERRRLGPLGDTVFKAVPSGGARHPTEAFVAFFEGSAIEPGLYHYDVIDHQLVGVRAGDARREWHIVTDGLLDALQPAQPLGVIVLATMWERAMWRYRDARSWRAPVVDVGHVVGTYRTVLTRLGLAHSVTRGFDDTAVAKLLDVDRLRLTPMSAIAFG
jgi:SagB-type dehydrogenase family enzyme